MIKNIYDFLCDFNLWSVLVRLCTAALLGGFIGSERGRHGSAAGLRTHILVCIGASLTSITSLFLNYELGTDGDVARLSAQVISGIGFLGAGMIIVKNDNIVTGLTTAAGMWATAAIGIAVGYGFYFGAIISAFICIFSVTVLGRLERRNKSMVYAYIELNDIADTEKVVDIVRQSKNTLVSYNVIPAKSGHAKNVGILCLLKCDEHFDEIKKSLYAATDVAMILRDIDL